MRRNLKLAGLACVALALSAGSAWAATAFSDPLTSASGSFTLSATDPVVYDAGGAHFGSGVPGDGGRSYLRTVDTDYAAYSFVAEVTFSITDEAAQQTFFGLGKGDVALFGTPDWSTQTASASFWPEANNDKITRFRTNNDKNAFADTTVAGFGVRTHRLQMTFDTFTKLLSIAIDLDYAGGPFVADAVGSNFPIATAAGVVGVNDPLYAADGWPNEPSSIFFGGDDGAILRDFSVTVGVPEPASAALVVLGVAGAFVLRKKLA